MGATTFMNSGAGKTADEAFKALRERALYEHGHAGYSGTIAEKRSFTMIALPRELAAMPQGPERRKAIRRFANELVEAGDPRVDDKWGPAGCIDCGEVEGNTPGERVFLFFGWASE